jgi:hypothetical protein
MGEGATLRQRAHHRDCQRQGAMEAVILLIFYIKVK